MSRMRDCAQCLRPFKPIQAEQKFCCRQCGIKYDRKVNRIKDSKGEPIPRLCIVCRETWFIPRNAVHRMCSTECRKAEIRSVAYAYWVAHKQRPKKQQERDIACIECEFWQARTDSDTGGECRIGRWMLCKPYLSNAKPYKLREQDDAKEPD